MRGRNKTVGWKYRLFVALWVSAGLILFLVSCATLPKQAETQESLRSTASRYWDLKVAGKYDDALKMEATDALLKENKSGRPLNEYYREKASLASNIASYKIKSVNIRDGKGTVNVEFLVSIPDVPNQIRQRLTEQWIFQDGRWLHLFH